MAGGIVGPQICAGGGGGGGNPPEAPGNQEVEVSGSADRMVISGRLETRHMLKEGYKKQNLKQDNSRQEALKATQVQSSETKKNITHVTQVF